MSTAVLLSGGVDSSVALHLARRQDPDTTAFYLKVWLEDELAHIGDCPWEEDLKYARAVCEQIDVPLEIVPLQTEYLERVVSLAISELKAGRTPSPDIFCNQRIKFGAFVDRIGHTFDRIVSGHYAKIERGTPFDRLKRSPDPVKDQTYFLCNLSQDQIRNADFPIGHLTKEAVRRQAADLCLPNRDRKDSQGICFLGKIHYPDFVRFHLGEQEGDILDIDTGRVLGRHQGFWFHTIGQRQGLGLGGGPWYVVGKDCEANVIQVSHQDRRDARLCTTFTVSEPNWIAEPPNGIPLTAKVRHGPTRTPCTIEPSETGYQVTLEQPDGGIAPGQWAVFYDGEYCLGGGIIG
jgi:tRNA-specific 2-thiouridylase